MIPVNEPLIAPHALTYISDCIKTGWISSSGPYLEKFEHAFATYIGSRFATTTTNGTTALHLALAALGITDKDEVIVPDLTIISCALAPIYLGAIPVFADVNPRTGTIDPSKLESLITKKTKAIMVVHLYGHPADMDPIMSIAKKHHLFVIEDAAEAHGAIYKGKKVGSIGDIGVFSFYGNKIITTGEGGMVISNNEAIIEKARLLKDLAHSPTRRFFHEEIGFNFRMTNMQAALGLAQLEEIDTYIRKKIQMAIRYTELLSDIPYLELPIQEIWATSVYWMYAVRVTQSSPLSRDELRNALLQKGVDTRAFFIPLHKQPVCRNYIHTIDTEYLVSNDLSNRGFYLPSGLAITEEQIKTVSHALKQVLS